MKVTEAPAHIAPEGEATTVTPAGALGVIAIVTPLDVAGLFVKQGFALEVITTVITSPSASVAEVKVEPVSDGMVVPPFFQT